LSLETNEYNKILLENAFMKIDFLGLILLLCAITVGCRTTEPGMSPADLKALVARADAAKQGCGDTPGREFANRLNSEWYPKWLAFLDGKEVQPKVGPQSMPEAVANITRVVGLAKAGAQWPMPQLTPVPRATGPITIDGRLDESDWTRAATFTGVYRFNDNTWRSEPGTKWKILWDDTDEGYTVEIAVPFNELPGYTHTGPKAGDRLHFSDLTVMARHSRHTPSSHS
jgi:hypothetical protein